MLVLKFFLTGLILFVLSSMFIHFTSEMKFKEEDIPFWAKMLAAAGFCGGFAMILGSILFGIWSM